MRAIEVIRAGGPDVLRLAERPVPAPGEGEVLVAVEAAGVNFTDIWTRIGLLPVEYPIVPGIEVVGRIVTVGAGGDQARVGTRVLGIDYRRMGGYAEMMVVPDTWTFPVDDRVAAPSAIGLGIAGMTAMAAVRDIGRVSAGERVVVLSAGGGVGSMALQLARAAGAEVIPVASAAKHAWLADRGFPDALDSAAWPEALQSRYPEGVDVILDGVGAASVDAGIARLRWGGRVVSFGAAELVRGSGLTSMPPTVGAPHLSALALAAAGRGVLGVTLAVAPERLAEWFAHLVAGHVAGSWSPLIGGVWPLESAAEVHRAVHDRTLGGKFILSFSGTNRC